MEESHQIDKIKKKRSRIIWGIILGLIGLFYIQYCTWRKPPLLNKEMVEIANEINKSCPMTIDSNTRCDNTVAMPNDQFQFNYTLVHKLKEEIDTVALKNHLIPIITNSLKTSPSMKYLRDNKFTVCYNYRDKNGNYLCNFCITGDQYTN